MEGVGKVKLYVGDIIRPRGPSSSSTNSGRARDSYLSRGYGYPRWLNLGTEGPKRPLPAETVPAAFGEGGSEMTRATRREHDIRGHDQVLSGIERFYRGRDTPGGKNPTQEHRLAVISIPPHRCMGGSEYAGDAAAAARTSRPEQSEPTLRVRVALLSYLHIVYDVKKLLI